jgi:Uma2 family endonuclease
MSAALRPPFEADIDAPPRKRFTRADVERLIAVGFFEGQRYELIDGDLIDKMGQKAPHAMAIQLLLAAFVRIVDALLIRMQLPMEVSAADRDRSLPEPDFAILASLKPDFSHRHPQGDEMLLVVEVSDTTAAFDLKRKAALYAAAGVSEYWVLDLGRRKLIVHRQLEGSSYLVRQELSEAESFSLNGRRETIRVGEILPNS